METIAAGAEAEVRNAWTVLRKNPRGTGRTELRVLCLEEERATMETVAVGAEAAVRSVWTVLRKNQLENQGRVLKKQDAPVADELKKKTVFQLLLLLLPVAKEVLELRRGQHQQAADGTDQRVRNFLTMLL